MTHSRHNSAESQTPAPRVVRHSPHVLNLKGTVIVVAEPIRPKNPYLGRFAAFHHLMDQHLHLREWRHRTLSVRPRGWRDFPPVEATTLAEAVGITAARFVNEHPLADLTVVSMAHLASLTVWKGLILPVEQAFARFAVRRAAPASSRAAAPAPVVTAPAPATTRAKGHVPRRRPAFCLPRLPHLAFELPRGMAASLAGFAAMAALMVAPAGAYGMMRDGASPARSLMQTARDAASSLVEAAQAAEQLDFAAADDRFRRAESDFTSADDGLGAFGRAVSYLAAYVSVDSQVAAAAPLLDAGREISAAGTVFSDTMRRITAHPEASNTDKLRLLDGAVAVALPHVEAAAKALDAVPVDAVPAAYRDRIAAAKAEAPRAVAAFREASPALQFLIAAAGGEGQRRYLVVFQNQTELRATGGFIGSFAIVDVKDGKLVGMKIPGGGSYDLQGQMKLRLTSPQPLHLINSRWQFQDANWYPDFPTTAGYLTDFYEQSNGGSTVDGVFAVNASVLVRLLRVLGAVDMPEYGKVITADNFLVETQKAVELEYDKAENKPKQFLADLAPKLIERALTMEPGTAVALGRELLAAAQEREVTVWMRADAEESMVHQLGWDGLVRSDAGDYLMIVHSNIGGQKTDGLMNDRVERNAKILPDGSVIVTLAMTRTHAGQKHTLFSGVRNVDYVRFYVPMGAELIDARGFDAPDPKLFKIAEDGYVSDARTSAEEAAASYDRTSGTRVSDENGRTVFGNWLQTDPGETTAATLIYRLPAGFVTVEEHKPATALERLAAKWREPVGPTMDYAFTFQKQSGANPTAVTSVVELPQTWYVQTAEPAVNADDRGRLTSTVTLDRDQVFRLTATTAAAR